MSRWSLLAVLVSTTLANANAAEPPNVVLIVCDDLGYGDLGCYGNPTIRTPHIDRLACSGAKFRNCYASDCVCTPSRAGMQTGRLPRRSGMAQSGDNTRRVLYTDSAGGLPASETTIAKLLKAKGYATKCVGKWHLGWHAAASRPTAHGYDSFWGLPVSNDLDPMMDAEGGTYYDVPVIENETEVERPAVQPTLTKRFTEQSVAFIRQPKGKPFFLYLAYTMPHVPLSASVDFAGKSPRGKYGDAVEEIDWSVGQIAQALKEERLTSNTLILFTSDNGPWLERGVDGGSAGILRNGKGSAWEGGVRVPFIASWPDVIPARTEDGLFSHLDLFPTIAGLASATLPDGVTYDGADQLPLLKATAVSSREAVYHWRGAKLFAVRQGQWKANFFTRSAYGTDAPVLRNPPWLFHLGVDPAEKTQLEASHPDTVTALTALRDTHAAGMVAGTPQLDSLIPPPP